MGTKIEQGQGYSTEWKQRGIAAAIHINLRVFWAKYGGRDFGTYQHFDLNAGSGTNEDIGCIGSPLAFMQALKIAGIGEDRFRGYFIEKNRDRAQRLLGHDEMKRHENHVIHGDNQEVIPQIPEIISLNERPQFAIGSVLVEITH